MALLQKKMRHFHICLLGLVALTTIFYILHSRSLLKMDNRHNMEYRKTPIHMVVVACGQRVQETLVMIKSAILFNYYQEYLKFSVFTEEHLMDEFSEKLSDWRDLFPQMFEFELLRLRFPNQSEAEWRNLFKPCAAQRLFLPFLNKFNESQIAALAPEHESENIGWYNRFARHPFYGPLGVNSGVMLMNLTRMRQFNWEQHILPIYKEYKLRITWGDQDIINILFYYHPDKLYLMPCEYNYRPDHCMYMSICNISHSGVKLIHGNRGYFHSNKQPLFRELYKAIETYQFGSSIYENFLLPLRLALSDKLVNDSSCGKISKDVIIIANRIFGNKF
ncbi:glucoside xylosyltransferase 2 isoform X2 [Drosophila busckii]|uniref:glucoside xylosyltransferase 2 isoform X2 n=1 Tax=Drosophila busckii TaxID=30019 RepID=UPI00083EAD6D|nr:glucoside xylosyltransferase 2 isoform X2 [Drosophila busckii]